MYAILINGRTGITKIGNPRGVHGGFDPEDIDDVRQHAPSAFLIQERAVTEDDYVAIVKRIPGVKRAVARFRWTGSWYTVFIAIDRFGGKKVDMKFKTKILNFLNSYRLAGYYLEIKEPQYVPLDIRMKVCVATCYFRDDVKQMLLDVFSNRKLPNGRQGFFHPDNFTFGDPVFLSQIYEIAMGIKGVTSVNVECFQRWGQLNNGEVVDGVIKIAASEIARLDNDRNFSENGRIEFIMEGGH